MNPINSSFDFNRDGILNPQEQFMEYMIFQEVMGENDTDDNDERNEAEK